MLGTFRLKKAASCNLCLCTAGRAVKLQKKLKNKVTGKALALLAPAHRLNRLDWKSDLHGAGHFGTLEIRSDVIELKATVEGSYHHLET